MTIKIIRDKLAARIPAHQICHVADKREHLGLLARKIDEERDEIIASNFIDAEEYADALEALMSMAELAGVDWGVIERIRLEKAEERGRFLEGVIYDPQAEKPLS